MFLCPYREGKKTVVVASINKAAVCATVRWRVCMQAALPPREHMGQRTTAAIVSETQLAALSAAWK